ncbi:hypothetical protein DSCW_30570 [Desulfosarcina widdelii]|uniref:Uncharacterized protein n=1 Tax=Desulfosarcina widdelii TaxID=947919 RepID=A0A5K7Z4L5_9BACT|nr:hypothetical protein [Desulfosarcina widdelii]BBO75640.1 hypothetical protein DSCW_30570 [Desulfosarcina widdelii]
MNWKFWKKTPDQNGGTAAHPPRSARPKDLPEVVGRKMVVSLKMDPDEVWALKCVSRPLEGRKKQYEFRIFSPNKAITSGVAVKDWSSLEDRPDLIMYSGQYNKETGSVDFSENS